jgi:hypothetical protein
VRLSNNPPLTSPKPHLSFSCCSAISTSAQQINPLTPNLVPRHHAYEMRTRSASADSFIETEADKLALDHV